METQVRTPQLVFMQPQRLVVPLFQRPYVWNEENQWAPLWADVTRVAERLIAEPRGAHQPHFLGAVVLQQTLTQTGSLQERTIIDGQQRLTTLQVLLDALHAELEGVGERQAALKVDALVENSAAFVDGDGDRFKVWPTNRDRPAFNEVMAAPLPVDYEALEHRDARLVRCHRFFAERARSWLSLNGPDDVPARARALEITVRDLLQLVVIDLAADENAQEIFETLNARGSQLTAADLIKNFVFQRLMESGDDVELAYEQHWKHFETAFWEAEISLGRYLYPRSAGFLNHWLIAQTGEEILAREVFARFKRYADHEADVPMLDLLKRISRASRFYEDFVRAPADTTGPLDVAGMFSYRVGTLESEVFKSVVLVLADPDAEPIAPDQLAKAYSVLESWLVRRTLVRATTKSYTQIASELVRLLHKEGRERAGDALEEFLARQHGMSRYWPDDDEVRSELSTLQVYRRIRRPRLRMVLEAIEDHRRGWRDGADALGGQRVPRASFAIEHLMPRKWRTHWPVEAGPAAEAERDQMIHTLGNLTLLTKRLNSKVSNAAWADKVGELATYDVLKIDHDLITVTTRWDEAAIRARTKALTDDVLQIWRVPEGHKSDVGVQATERRRKIEIADLMGAGMIEAGATLHARSGRHSGRTATVLPDGRLDVDGEEFGTPTGAATAIRGKMANGWTFFLVDLESKRRLKDVWRDYVEMTLAEADDSEVEDDDDDEAAGD